MTKVQVFIESELQDLIPQFLENRKKDIISLVGQVEAADIIAIGQLAHKIKGSSASYGFQELSRIAAELEMASKANDMATIQSLVPNLKAHLENIEIVYRDAE